MLWYYIKKQHKKWHDTIYTKMSRKMLVGNTPKCQQQLSLLEFKCFFFFFLPMFPLFPNITQ